MVVATRIFVWVHLGGGGVCRDKYRLLGFGNALLQSQIGKSLAKEFLAFVFFACSPVEFQ